MTELVLLFVAVICLATIPVMLAAKMLGAGNPGFGSALLANFLSGCFSAALDHFLPDGGILVIAIAVVGSAAIFAFVLGTTIIRGFFISVLAVLIVVAAIFLLGGSVSLFGGPT